MSQTTLATIPRLIGQVLSIYDVDAEAVFAAADIDLSADTQNRVAMDKMSTLWQLAVQENAE